MLSTIVLQQVLYWWNKSKRKQFYKFRDKCNHALYSEGDSWIEELGFTGREFDTAIKRIGFKLGKTDNDIKKEEAFIIYFRDKQGVTWWDINADYLEKRMIEIFSKADPLVINKSAITKYSTNPQLHNTKTTKADIKELDLNKPLRKELEDLDFSDQEIDVLLEIHTPNQIKEKLKALEHRKDIRTPKAYLIKILKADYPNRDIPVISDNGNNGDHSEDFNILKYKPVKDDRTLEEIKKDREKIAKLAGEAAKKMRRGKFNVTGEIELFKKV